MKLHQIGVSPLKNLNYYLSFDVCARFRLRLSVCVCFCELFNGYIYQRMLVNKVDTFLKRIKIAVLFLIFFWTRSVQNGSNLIKLDQIGFPHQSTNVTIKSFHIYRKDKMAIFFLIFFIRSVQNGSN